MENKLRGIVLSHGTTDDRSLDPRLLDWSATFSKKQQISLLKPKFYIIIASYCEVATLHNTPSSSDT